MLWIAYNSLTTTHIGFGFLKTKVVIGLLLKFSNNEVGDDDDVTWMQVSCGQHLRSCARTILRDVELNGQMSTATPLSATRSWWEPSRTASTTSHPEVWPRLHQESRTRVSTCCRQRVSCVGNKIVASLSPVCCWIQRDTSRPWHKMYSNYVAEIQSTCIPNEQLVFDNMCSSTCMYPDTSWSSGQHVAGLL